MPDMQWRKSSYSGQAAANDCVEVACGAPDLVLLRESDDPERVITAAPAAVETFVAAVKEGGFDRLAR